MQKISIYLIICILSIIILNSCTQKTIKTTEKIHTQKFFLSADTTKGALSIDINAEIPTMFKDKIVLDSIRTMLISNLFGTEYIKLVTDSIIPNYVSELINEYKLNNKPLLEKLNSTTHYGFNNEQTLEGFTLLSDENIFSYGINRYVFMGGAHGLNNRTYFNFDLKTGKLINESDLFVDSFEVALSEIIKIRIVEQSKEDPELDPILKLEDTNYWIQTIRPNGNFYITDQSINFVFNPYEIAPYYMGQTEVIIPFKMLTSILKPENVISYLIYSESKN